MFISSCKLFFKNLRLIVPSIVLLIISVIIFLPFFISMGIGFESASPEYILSYIGGILGILLLILLVLLVLGVIVHCWTLQMTTFAVKGVPYKLIDSLKKSLKYFWRILGLFAIEFAIMVVITIVLSIAIAILLFNSTAPKGVSPEISSSLIVSILFVIIFVLGVIFLSFSMLPISYIIINDDLGIGEGFSTGFKFGVKKFFRIFGISILYSIIITLLGLPFDNNDGVFFIIFDILLQFIGASFSTILGIYMLKLYNKNNISLNGVNPINKIKINNEPENN